MIPAWGGRGVVGPPLGTRRCGDVVGGGFFAAGCRVVRRAAGVGGMLATWHGHQGGVVEEGSKAIRPCLLILVDVNLCVSSLSVFFCK